MARLAGGPQKLPDPAGAVGFVHFWNFGGPPEARAAGMLAYCERLSEHLAAAADADAMPAAAE